MHVEWFLFQTRVIAICREKSSLLFPFSSQVTFATQFVFTDLLPMLESASCKSTMLLLLEPFIIASFQITGKLLDNTTCGIKKI